MLTNKGIIQLGMTTPNRPIHSAFNQELRRVTQYDSESLKETVLRNFAFLNEPQKYAYDMLMRVVNEELEDFVLLDAPDGTGKSF